MPKTRLSIAIVPLSVATSDLIADVQAMAGHDGVLVTAVQKVPLSNPLKLLI